MTEDQLVPRPPATVIVNTTRMAYEACRISAEHHHPYEPYRDNNPTALIWPPLQTNHSWAELDPAKQCIWIDMITDALTIPQKSAAEMHDQLVAQHVAKIWAANIPPDQMYAQDRPWTKPFTDLDKVGRAMARTIYGITSAVVDEGWDSWYFEPVMLRKEMDLGAASYMTATAAATPAHMIHNHRQANAIQAAMAQEQILAQRLSQGLTLDPAMLLKGGI